ncbi:hypothetical protein quinque_015742 [Culex quinquefasciatus]
MEAFINEMVQPRVLDLIVLILPKWKLLVYILLMNITIFSPLYFFNVVLIGRPDLQLICPSVLLFGFNLIHRALFVRHNLNNTRSMLTGGCILSAAITTSGLVSMLTNDRGTVLTVVLLYSFVGGYGYHLVFSKMWKVLAKIFNAKKEMFVIKFLHSFGQSVTPLVLLALFHCPWTDYIYGALLVLFGGLLLNLIPVTILIENEKNFLKLDQDSCIKHTAKGKESFYADVAKSYSAVAVVESEQPNSPAMPESAMSWKNPAKCSRDEYVPVTFGCEDDFDDDGVDRDGKYFNADGVEILEMIVEEDEENMAEYEAAGEQQPPGSKTGSGEKDHWFILNRLCTGLAKYYHSIRMRQNFNGRLLKSLRFALRDLKFYSCLLLKSTDLCVFLLFLTLLPRFMQFHYQFRGNPRRMVLLAVVIISASWAMCAMLLLWCDLKFRKQQDKLLIFSILFKVFGYFCVYSTRSSFWTVSGCVLIGVGHSIACSYQEFVIKRKFTASQWSLVKGALCLVGGLLVVVIASLINVAYVYCKIDNVLLVVLLLYCFSGSVWLACNFRIIFR